MNSHDFECRDVAGRFCAWSIGETLPGQRQDYDASALTRPPKRYTASPEATCLLYDQPCRNCVSSSIPRPMTYRAIPSKAAFPHMLLAQELEHFCLPSEGRVIEALILGGSPGVRPQQTHRVWVAVQSRPKRKADALQPTLW
jgi:hypothetical protein